MRRLLSLAGLATILATQALAQALDPHAGHHMPAPAEDPHAGHAPADPHAGHHMPTPADDPHAGHHMPPPADDPHAGHAPADPHAGHHMPAPADDPHAGHAMTGAQLPVGDAAPPPPPADYAADRIFSPDAMARARETLIREHGRVRYAMTLFETLELRPAAGGAAYAWAGRFSYGGDINRLTLKTHGEGRLNHRLEKAEVQALYARALGPYFDLQAGLRQDFRPRPQRTYAALGVEGLAPYLFEVGATAFISDQGHLSARLKGGYDFHLTQRVVLEPHAELNLSASEVRELNLGAGLSNAEVSLRLRYDIRRELSPYIGLHYERKFGDTAAFARAAGDHVSDTRFVIGLRAWF